MAEEIQEATHNNDSDVDMSDGSSDDASDAGNDVDERGNLKGFVVDNDDDEEYEEPKHKKVKPVKVKRKSKDSLDIQRTLGELRAKSGHSEKSRRRYIGYLRSIWQPSSKITKCRELVASIQETTDEKVIIFSQWTMVLDLLEIDITDKLGLRVCHYYGNMTAPKRDATISRFTEDPDMKVILVSLKAGNAGLNLTAASQVIIVEPFWNPYVENQAIDRTYRIGQMRDVTVHRILAEGTVEDRILQVQNEKRQIIDAALTGGSTTGLGTANLAFLFGVGENPDADDE